jgi:hypothetical protein
MVDWVITDGSNAMDKVVSYKGVLNAMRQHVALGGNALAMPIHIKQGVGANPPTTTLTMTNNNFTVTMINGAGIVYNYVLPLPVLRAADIPTAFPTGLNAATANQKAILLYMFPEAARSAVIEAAIIRALEGGQVTLGDYAPLVNNYGKTCTQVGVNVNNPARVLVAGDYTAFANTLPMDTPDKASITNALL